MPPRTPHPDRAVRSLAHLEASGSTARSFNLVGVWKRHGKEVEYREQPFFRNHVFNRSLIVKHRLRGHEEEIVSAGRTVATKVALPIDTTDLRSGARSFFVGERGYKQQLENFWWRTSADRERDVALLALLDGLPSFDPFLMRERLSQAGYTPARCYFDLSEADSARMLNFVRQEVEPLVGISFSGRSAGLDVKIAKLASKIMTNAGDAELEPLRTSLGMDRSDFEEGVFCWKGFIYYKWCLSQVRPEIAPVLAEIGSVHPRGWTTDHIATITAARLRLVRAVSRAGDKVRSTLDIYEAAYSELTRQGRPQAFRNFLFEAPRLFYELGDRLSAVQHIVSFWRFRFPQGKRITLQAEDMIDLMADFQNSLSLDDAPPPASLYPAIQL